MVLSAAHRARIPASVRFEPRPMLWRWPFMVAAGLLFAANALILRDLAGVLVALLLALPVALCWYRPMAAWWAMVAGLAVTTPFTVLVGGLVVPPWYLNQLPVPLIVLYVLALSVPLRVALPALAITLGVGCAIAALVVAGGPNTATGVLTWALALVVALLLGHASRARRESTLRIAEERGLRRVLEERARIARDLHDVVAHHMSVIAVQAATAPYRIGEGMSERVAAEFEAVNAAARSSLGELRQLLSVLRDPSAPQPGLAELPGLVAATRSAGLPVRLELPDPLPAVPDEVSQAAYRIAQESMSNVVRHAAGASTVVRAHLDEKGGSLVIEVVNGRPPAPLSPLRSGGGLEGMRERVAALGGSLAAGPDGEGGFAVRAMLPLGSDGEPAR
ncbi:sensor histidine kinase [Nonomuraea africana]|uniref:histidine kinase n=1 Tax=Nonomuraea africana TaxID=46171 RepID=A0ABR9KLJ5_9ACTN|nr:histidine kinase [Nonomuraea africana]MBE1562896.1 signal transduction histidine kinase [Nonomuraea africana]